MKESTDKNQETIIVETEPYTVVIKATVGYGNKFERWLSYSYTFNGEEWGMFGHAISHLDPQAVLDHVRTTFQYLEIHFQNVLRSSIETLINEGNLTPRATELFEYTEPPEKWVKRWNKKLLTEQKKRLHLPEKESKGGSEYSIPRYLRQQFAGRANKLYPLIKKAQQEYKKTPPSLRKPEIILNSDYGRFISRPIVEMFEERRPTDLTLMQAAKIFEWNLSLATLWKYYQEFYEGFGESKVVTKKTKLKEKNN